jgi:polysaccharide export outer membrane protein
VAAAGQTENEVLFDVVEVDNHVVSTLLAQPKESFHARFEKDGNPPELKIAVGDTVSVTIWESAAGGLFSEAPAPQLPTGPTPEIDQLLGAPNQPPGAPPETPPPQAGQPPSGNIPPTVPLPIEATGAAVNQRSATIPDQQVAPDGAISVPFAGQVPAAGRTPAELQQTIEALLASKALQPQALVIVKKSDANAVTVTGEVVAGARVPLSPRGDRLLQVIAAAGGVARPAGIAAAGGITTPAGIAAAGSITTPAGIAAAGGITTPAGSAAGGGLAAPVYETFVRLSRDGVTATIPFERLVADPVEDIYARPGDVLTLVRIPQTFSVFGATGRIDSVTFDAEKLTLSEALAKSQGLRDDLANPKGVFLFRYEPVSVVRALDQPIATRAQDGTSPVAYRFDFSDANSYLIADQFPVRDKDIIFVADAGAVQVQKLFTVLQTITGPVITGLLVCRSSGVTC